MGQDWRSGPKGAAWNAMKRTVLFLVTGSLFCLMAGCAQPEQGDPNATKTPETKSTDAPKNAEGAQPSDAPKGK